MVCEATGMVLNETLQTSTSNLTEFNQVAYVELYSSTPLSKTRFAL